MTYYIHEYQNRPDGKTNLIDTVSRASLSTAAAYYYGRCSTASANENMLSCAIFMTDNEGRRILPRYEDEILIEGAYTPAEE